jgi:hypothetical protein
MFNYTDAQSSRAPFMHLRDTWVTVQLDVWLWRVQAFMILYAPSPKHSYYSLRWFEPLDFVGLRGFKDLCVGNNACIENRMWNGSNEAVVYGNVQSCYVICNFLARNPSCYRVVCHAIKRNFGKHARIFRIGFLWLKTGTSDGGILWVKAINLPFKKAVLLFLVSWATIKFPRRTLRYVFTIALLLLLLLLL